MIIQILKRSQSYDIYFTDEIWDKSAIGESARWVLKEGFAVGIEIRPSSSVEVVIVSRIEKRIAEDEEAC